MGNSIHKTGKNTSRIKRHSALFTLAFVPVTRNAMRSCTLFTSIHIKYNPKETHIRRVLTGTREQ